MEAKQAQSKLDAFKLDPSTGRRLADAAEMIGELRLLARLWPLWPAFAAGPWRSRCFAADAALRGREVDPLALLALGPVPEPVRPNLGMRWVVGQMLSLNMLEKIDIARPINLRAVTDAFWSINAPQFARRAALTTGSVAEPPSAAAVWSQGQRWVDAGLAPLVVAGLALASWEREGPDHSLRSPAGRVLLMALAPRLGLPAEAFANLAEGLVEAVGPEADLEKIIKRLRMGKGWRWWLETFLAATALSAAKALEIGLAARAVHLDHRDLVITWIRAPRYPLQLLELLIARPVIDLPTVAAELEVTQRTAGLLANKLLNLGLIEETTGQKRGRRYAYTQIIELLEGLSQPDEYMEGDDPQPQ